MEGRPTWTDCDEARDYVVPNASSPRDLVFRPDIMEETVPHTHMVKKHSKHLLLLWCPDFNETWYVASGAPPHYSLYN